jgi:hypothetical protein
MLSLLIAAALLAQPVSSQNPPVAKTSIQNSTVQQMDARNGRDSANAKGGEYEARVMGILIDEMGLLRKCEMSPKQSPFSMYLDIAADGAIKDLRFVPATPMDACIRRTVAGKKFSPFKGGFLVKLIISAV